MNITSFLILFSALFFWTCFAVQPSPPHDASAPVESYQCHPFGQCEPCPEDALHEPFCKPFGHRRVVHCMLRKGDGSDTVGDPHNGAGSGSHPIYGEIPAWETCGRSVRQETADFWEFVFCNAALASISLFVLYNRSRAIASLRRKALVARIGIQRTW
ncbi:hypothetical protein M408DRAFT_84088 [Serendipita vermifera MAFF 305830]|uniref:Uncharacterized protein n=1 Tax=Serendipita vermifera MAFF 305830 TaxID=933852 RepID=A0A0C3BQL2_SERVB|nr:hypothetical protein M408DRAFT_84088 [Serendipita vermifera MAFF 305830]